MKALAALEGQSTKDYILDKLFNSSSEKEIAAMKELEELIISRINKAKISKPSSLSIQRITSKVIKSWKSE